MSDIKPSHVSVRATIEGPQGCTTMLDDPNADRWHVCLWRAVPDCEEIECIYHRVYRRRHFALKLARRLAEQFSIGVISLD